MLSIYASKVQKSLTSYNMYPSTPTSSENSRFPLSDKLEHPLLKINDHNPVTNVQMLLQTTTIVLGLEVIGERPIDA